MSNDEKFYNLLSKLQALELKQTTAEFFEEEMLPVELYEEMLQRNHVASNLHIEKRRWHETSTDVYEIYGRFLGVRKVSDLYSDLSDFKDIYWSYWFGEMEAVTSISYVAKK